MRPRTFLSSVSRPWVLGHKGVKDNKHVNITEGNAHRFKMRFIRKSDCWCATVLKLNFILYINTKRPCKAIWLLFWLILFCFVSFCFFLHFCSVIFVFRSVPVGESSFSLSLQNIVSVRLGSSP